LLAQDEVVVGRSPYCSIVLDHETLSRVHASFRVAQDGGVLLSDLGSSNGTFVNGARVDAPVRVGIGDEIRLGQVHMWLEAASARPLIETGKFARTALTDDTSGVGPDPRRAP
jgi:predicted component of type VI protein secretion system